MVWAVSLSTTDLSTRSLTADHNSLAFGVYLRLVIRDGPLTQTVLYLQESLMSTLALKLFRREPAISKFVWNFSATHKSSKYNPTLELCLNLARSLQTDLNSLFWEDDF